MRQAERGFTMIELMVAMAVATVIIGMLYTINFGMLRLVRTQDAQITMMEEGRNAMRVMTSNLRMSSYGWMQATNGGVVGPLTGGTYTDLQYQRPDDLDGNGNAVNAAFALELRPTRIFAVDNADANGDGRTVTQLVELNADGSFRRVLTNNLSPAIAPGGGAGFYDAPQGGFVITDTGAGLQITLIMRRLSMGGGPTIVARLDEFVIPRN